MSETPIPSTTVRVRGNRVRVTASGDFQDEISAYGGLELWPPVNPQNQGEVGNTPQRFWDWEFPSNEEAIDFAAQCQSRITDAKAQMEWEEPV